MPTKKENTKRSIVLEEDDQIQGIASPAKAWFLGIGIDEYKEFPKLNNAVKDVKDVMEVLIHKYDLDEENAFLLLNEEATEDNIIEKLDFFSKKLSGKDKLMIYYSGHGHMDRSTGLGFWIPQDAIQGKTSRYIRNSTIRDYINVIKSRHTLLISDSCFSGSLFVRGASRATNSAVEELESLESRWAICSGRADEEVNDGPPGGNSPFAESIIDTLKRNQEKFLNIAKIADKVIMQTRSNYEQLPEGNPLYGVGHKGGQYIFRLKANEKEAWSACQKEGTLAAYQLFLINYPDGNHVEEAKQELAFLKEEKAWADAVAKNTIAAYTEYDQHFPNGRYARQSLEAIAELEDHQSWEKAQRRNTISAYKEYLLGHPNGDHAAEAKANLNALVSGKTPESIAKSIVPEEKISTSEANAGSSILSDEEKAWELAKTTDTEEAYNQFYLRFPRGKFQNQVKEALKRFKTEKQEATPKEVPIVAQKPSFTSPKLPLLKQNHKIAIGIAAVVVPLLIWGLISILGGRDGRGEPEFNEAQMMQMMTTRGFDVTRLNIELDGDRLNIFGRINSEEEKQNISNYLLSFADVASVNNTKLEVVPPDENNEGKNSDSGESSGEGVVEADLSSRALNFDGQGDYISFKNPKSIPIGNAPYTIEAWVYANKMGSLGIVGWGAYHTTNQTNALRLDGSGISHYWWGNDLLVKTEDITYQWNHIAASFDGITRSVYLNGMKIGSDTPKGHNVPNADNLTIGKTCDNCGGEFFNGKIDEVRIWDKARSAEDIQNNMLKKLSGNESGLVAYYNFDQGEAEGNNTSVKELKDLSGNSNNGMLNGFQLKGKTSNWTTGIDLLSADAEAVLDQSQKTSGGTFGSPDRWQSFTAGKTGYLTKVGALHYSGKQVGKLYIYEGEGKDGTLLHYQPTVADGTKLLYFPLTKGVRIEKDKKYTIRFDKFAWFVGKGNAYAGGRADFNSGVDFYFETYVVEATE